MKRERDYAVLVVYQDAPGSGAFWQIKRNIKMEWWIPCTSVQVLAESLIVISGRLERPYLCVGSWGSEEHPVFVYLGRYVTAERVKTPVNHEFLVLNSLKSLRLVKYLIPSAG